MTPRPTSRPTGLHETWHCQDCLQLANPCKPMFTIRVVGESIQLRIITSGRLGVNRVRMS